MGSGISLAVVVAVCGSGRNDAAPSATTAAGGSTTPGATSGRSTLPSATCSTLTQGVSGDTIKLGTSLPLSGNVLGVQRT